MVRLSLFLVMLSLPLFHTTEVQENCNWNIEHGWYGGTYIKEFLEPNKYDCAQSCCNNTQCVTWTWRNDNKYCILKKGDDPTLYTEKGHFSSIKNQDSGNTVSCGAHRATTCAECPQGNGAAWCNGACVWKSGSCLASVTCKKKQGSNGVTDQWCDQNCRGGQHPACNPANGVHQRCVCNDDSIVLPTDNTVCERMKKTSSIVEFVECNETHHENPKSCKAYLKTETRQTCEEFCENANLTCYDAYKEVDDAIGSAQCEVREGSEYPRGCPGFIDDDYVCGCEEKV